VIDSDRWWIAYCALGAALIIRAPSWGWAVFLIVLWPFVLYLIGTPGGRARLKVKPRREGAPLVSKSRLDLVRSQWAGVPVPAWEEKTVTFNPVAAPEAVTKADLPKVPGGPLPSEARPSGRVSVTLSGTVWTTESLIAEIQQAIERAKDKGEPTP
jgi:hypothetical protein